MDSLLALIEEQKVDETLWPVLKTLTPLENNLQRALNRLHMAIQWQIEDAHERRAQLFSGQIL